MARLNTASFSERWLHHSIIHEFRHVRRQGRKQFAVVHLVHSQQEKTKLNLVLVPWLLPQWSAFLSVLWLLRHWSIQQPNVPGLSPSPTQSPFLTLWAFLVQLGVVQCHPYGDSGLRISGLTGLPVLHPPAVAAVTYLATGTDGGIDHSEKILLENFQNLWQNFRQFYREDPVEIVLYTWILPCPSCTASIIETLAREEYKGAKKRIVFTDPGENIPYINGDKTVEHLTEASFRVHRETCWEQASTEQCFLQDILGSC